MLTKMLKIIIFDPASGGIAQLARALAWHARGREFESHYLHFKVSFVAPFFISLRLKASSFHRQFLRLLLLHPIRYIIYHIRST